MQGKDFQVESIGRETVDLSSPIPSSFKTFLSLGSYEFAIICSAITDVEKCYLDQTNSNQVNVTGTFALLKALQEAGVVPVFFSSDYVFRYHNNGYREDDQRNPATCYGAQKLAVENYIENNFERFLIFRTSKLMSMTGHPKNILYPIINNLKNAVPSNCFKDQWLNPVFVEDISKVIELSCNRNLSGIYHLGTRQVMTRYEIGILLANSLGYDECLIRPISMKEIAVSEPRPSHNVLICKKAEDTLDFRFMEVAEGLKQLAATL